MFGWTLFPQSISGNFLIRLAASCLLGAGIGLERSGFPIQRIKWWH